MRLAKFYATANHGDKVPTQKMWSKHIIWGSHRLGSGMLDINANAFKVGTNWGVAKTDDGDNIVWGTADDGDNIVWGTADLTNIVWSIVMGGK